MGDVDALCRRIVIIDKGRMLYDNDIDHLKGFFGSYRTLKVFATKKEVTWLIVGWVAALVVLPLSDVCLLPLAHTLGTPANARGKVIVVPDVPTFAVPCYTSATRWPAR